MAGKKRNPGLPTKNGKVKVAKVHQREYIGESKNKEYAKQKIDNKIYVFSIDKNTQQEKRMTYKGYQALKKRINITQSSRVLMEAKEATNQEFGKRIWYKKDDSIEYEYKKFAKVDKHGKRRVFFLELESTPEYKSKPTRLLSFKQAKVLFVKLQRNKAIKDLQLRGYNKTQAEKKYKENQKNLYNTRIAHIQQHRNLDKKGAIAYYKGLVRKGDFATLKAYNYDGWKRIKI